MQINWKEAAKTAAICGAMIWAYHNGALNFVPGFKGVKDIKDSDKGAIAAEGAGLVFKRAA